LSFIPLTQISLVTDHQVDEFARFVHLFFLLENISIRLTLFSSSIMSGVTTRGQSKKAAQPATQSSHDDDEESIFSERSVSQSSSSSQAQSIIKQEMQEMMQQMFQVHIHSLTNRVVALEARISFVFVSQSVSASQFVSASQPVPAPQSVASIQPSTENR
jgi:hypothetical protein